MKKSTHKLALILSLTVLLAAIAGILAALGFWWLVAVACVMMLCCFFSVLRRATRSIKDMKRLIDAIRFDEMNISFRPAIKKGLPEKMAQMMEESIMQFRRRLIQAEADQMFYDTLLQRIDSGIMVLDKQGHIEWINKTAVDMFGRPQPRNLSDLEQVSAGMPAMLNELAPRDVKLLTIQKNSIPNSFAVTATYFSSGGKDFKLISFKNIQSALEEHEIDAWRKLISVLTHEMMNSITPILSLSETLSEETVGNNESRYEIMQRAMQTIHRRSKGLFDFVKNYRKLTRIPEPILVSIPVQEMMTDIHRLLKAEGIDFSYNIQPKDIQLFADRMQVEQLLINLIKNAYDACRDVPHPKINVEVRKSEQQKPVITVSDNGYGIIPEVMDKIFVPFFTTKTGGSGIGLTICRQIMNLHHGSISIESEVDKRTMVKLRF
jgi:nitrogen fixation/metabolism regulation signal transduction histidine kinase